MPTSHQVFSYLTADKADQYRQVLQVFLQAKQRFVLNLRPDEVVASLRADGVETDRDAVQSLLAKLQEWGNLRADADTAEVATVEEFYRSRFLYQLTVEGEAAERAVAHFEELLIQPGELQSSALADIQELLAELSTLAASAEPDAGKVFRSLSTLTARFEELTDRARTFITGLQRTVDLHGIDLEAFLAYKDRLIEYLERFIGDLVVAQGRIARLLAEVDEVGSARLLAIAADRELADRLEVTDDDRAGARARWEDRWAGLSGWFVAPAGTRAQADVLRERARQAIPDLLQAVSQINEQRISRTDRPADLRTLARWFAQCPTEADAHRLWRVAFGLAPARHLKVDADTLDRRADHPVPASTSWLDAPPLVISPQLRRTGRYVRRGRPTSIIDRSAEKALLARQAREEAAQLAAAKARLLTDGTVRLSDLGELDRQAFGLFLDLLGEALALPTAPGRPIVATSSDGALQIELTPTTDGDIAAITTRDGVLHGPDHHIRIADLAGPVGTASPDEPRATDTPPTTDEQARWDPTVEEVAV